MNLPELRVLAEKAKAFRPLHWCSFNEAVWSDDCGACARIAAADSCPECLGARRAVEDIASAIDGAVTEAEEVFKDGPVKAMKWDNSGIIDLARKAASIAGYFGDCAPVAAFEAGVREMCNG